MFYAWGERDLRKAVVAEQLHALIHQTPGQAAVMAMQGREVDLRGDSKRDLES